MATRKQKAKVGLFLVICILLIAGGILLMSGYRHEPKVHYWTEFNEPVLGLGTNSVVTYLGVPVGRVSDIYVTDNYTAHVDMEILVNKVTLRSGVEAKLVLYSLATGTLAIGLSSADSNAPLLPPGSEIPSTPSLVETLSSQIENLLDNLNDFIERASDVIDEAQEFADRANEVLDDLGKDADVGLKGFNDLVKDVKKLVQSTEETVQTLHGQLEELSVGETNETLKEALKNVADLAERLQKTADSVTETGEGAAHNIDNMQLNLRETMRVLNETLNSVRDLADYLLQDPSALVRGKGRPRGGSE